MNKDSSKELARDLTKISVSQLFGIEEYDITPEKYEVYFRFLNRIRGGDGFSVGDVLAYEKSEGHLLVFEVIEADNIVIASNGTDLTRIPIGCDEVRVAGSWRPKSEPNLLSKRANGSLVIQKNKECTRVLFDPLCRDEIPIGMGEKHLFDDEGDEISFYGDHIKTTGITLDSFIPDYMEG